MKQRKLKPLTACQRKLVEEYVPFAMNMGTRFAGLGDFKGVAKEDLQQEACLGLCIAAQKFDATLGVDFKTYAYDWCRRYIMRAIDGEPLSSADADGEDVVDIVDDTEADQESIARVMSMLEQLNRKEREVVCLIYGLSYCKKSIDSEPRGFQDVAAILHIRSTRVHQIYEQAMAKMEFNA